MERVKNDEDETHIAYEVDGPADAPVIAFCEGLGYGRWMWRFQRRRLDEYRTIVFDNRGTGDSDVPEPAAEDEEPRYSIELFASDLETVLDAEGVDSAHVVGASMGGMTAQRYAKDYDRAESLTLLCTSHGGEEAVPTPPETQERMFNVPPEYDEREALRYKMQPAMSDDFWEDNDDLVEEIIDWRLTSDAPPEARLAQAGAVAAFDSTPWLDDLDLPTMVLHGTADRVLPVENGKRLHERLPESDLDLYEHGSHLFFIESADAVTAAIREHVEADAP
ncbi:alpha/beta fold hydrolase [Haloarchaeobius sp. HME9146]|uniref:alpha/beta fold hydrolase n=1 Tax=Haloarchaeobius sp. HME9146 TaxID=2978732 RepID=UPI0021C14EC1|nr:alpha/beta hydrolase [Haloarchaeobius sp. HME9146]MCT9095088.1 alpha/beta hydrolase [Haloarchaeobius sp. HME9146]